MRTEPISISRTAEWQAVQEHHAALRDAHLRDLFERDPQRGATMAAEAGDLYLDYSKHRLVPETIRLLCRLAERAGLRQLRDDMFAGRRINVSEDRAVLHVALRMPAGEALVVEGRDVAGDVQRVRARMAAVSERIRSGAWRGHSGRPIRNVVNIGIGGSSLGPAMAYEALPTFSPPHMRFRFVSNADGADLREALGGLDPAETVFIVCSKTFTTVETQANAHSARDWLLRGLGERDAVRRHFLAVSVNLDQVREFGIDVENTFEMWDWVGGRYSMDSAVGLSLMVAIGPERFGEMLDGFHAMDEHFRTAPFERNLPVLMGLIGVWYRNFFGAETQAVIPYSHDLRSFPAYLQQLEMESNGKSVGRDGRPLETQSAPVVWGQAATNGQHAFFQLLHQGTALVPCDFIGFCRGFDEIPGHQDLLLASLFGQAQALAFGRTPQELQAEGVPAALVPHRTFPGNRPTSTILAAELDPRVLGQLVALYEHKVFTQGCLWGVDSFDQWGVELGKELATKIRPQLAGEDGGGVDHDSSTSTLIRRYRETRAREG